MAKKPGPDEIATLVRDIVDRRKRRVMPAEFLEKMIDQIGGPDELAKLVIDQLVSPNTAAHVKQRIISDFMRLMIDVGRNHPKSAELDGMTVADLEKTALNLLQRAEELKGAKENLRRLPGPAPTTAGDVGDGRGSGAAATDAGADVPDDPDGHRDPGKEDHQAGGDAGTDRP